MSVTQANGDPDSPKLVQLSDGVWVRQEIDNMGWIDIGGALVVVDALERGECEEEVFALLEDTAPGKRAAHVLNTHTHYDHTALNPAFCKRHGADIVNARTTEIPPEGLWYDGGKRRVQMLPLPDCHTPEDCIVWVPDDSVLFVGDIFGWGLIPWDHPLTRAKADVLTAAYGKLIDFGARHIVPGHGPVCSTDQLRRWVTYFRETLAAVAEAVADGAGQADILAAVPPPADMHEWWRFVAWKHQDVLDKVVCATKAGDV